MQKNIQHNKDEQTQFFRKIYLSLYSKGFERVTKLIICERWVGDWTDLQHIDPRTLLATAAFLSRSLGLLNRGPGGPASLGHGSHSRIFFPTHLTSYRTRVISLFDVHRLPVASQFSLNSTHRQSRLSSDIFDRMYLLFTQVHFSSDSFSGSEVNMLQHNEFLLINWDELLPVVCCWRNQKRGSFIFGRSSGSFLVPRQSVKTPLSPLISEFFLRRREIIKSLHSYITYALVEVCIYFTQPLTHGHDVTQGSFLRGEKLILFLNFTHRQCTNSNPKILQYSKQSHVNTPFSINTFVFSELNFWRFVFHILSI